MITSRMGMKEWVQRCQPVQLYLVLALTIIVFVVELVISHLTHALTLLMDSYHMLCNIIALAGCIITIKVPTVRQQKPLPTAREQIARQRHYASDCSSIRVTSLAADVTRVSRQCQPIEPVLVCVRAGQRNVQTVHYAYEHAVKVVLLRLTVKQNPILPTIRMWKRRTVHVKKHIEYLHSNHLRR